MSMAYAFSPHTPYVDQNRFYTVNKDGVTQSPQGLDYISWGLGFFTGIFSEYALLRKGHHRMGGFCVGVVHVWQ